ncbi:MAG: hypothetical protein A2Y23_09055 [Clostridiales bacterium GWB2_37_7]|nr:MAG: hypothetical protein A2Y23_09055 [Clostridiales bacterium GWB2_37_7]
MKRDVLGQCPICSGKIEVTEFKCGSCASTIRGSFKLCKFCQLPKEQIEFAEIFIKNRGNIKEIERELGISYPTVKGKLDSLIESLGYKNQAACIPNKNKDILERLDRGEISSEEAIELLKY